MKLSRHLLAILAGAILSGCATTPEPTLNSLMRSSYLIGCEDEGILMVQNDLERRALEERCEIKSMHWDIHQVGVYRDELEVHRVKRNQLDRR